MPEPIDDFARWNMTTIRNSLITGTAGEEIQAGPVSVRVSDLPLFRQEQDGRLWQAIRLWVRSDTDAGTVTFRAIQGGTVLAEQTTAIAGGEHSLHLFVPEVDATTRFAVGVSGEGFDPTLAAIEVRPQRKWTVHLIHQSHFDHGYTDPQAVVMEQHLAYLDAALRIAESTDAFPDDAKFRWNVEVTYPLQHWLAARPAAIRDEFIRRVKEGRIEVNALSFSMHTEAYSVDELARQLWFADEFREQYDLPIVSAMQTDVPGATIGLLHLLVDAGVRSFSVAHNYAGRSQPYLVGGQALTRPFWWQAANGQRLLVWYTDTPHGVAYMEGNLTGLAEDVETATATLPEYLNALAQRPYPFGKEAFGWGDLPAGQEVVKQPYPHDILHLRIQSVIADNAPPSPLIPEIVKQWNEQWAHPKLRMATNREFFALAEERLGDRIETHHGDWTDWWADGIGSAARALGRGRVAQGAIRTAQTMHALADHVSGESNPAGAAAIDRVYDDLALFDEHTWGAGNPWQNRLEKFAAGELQWEKKIGYAHDAFDAGNALLSAGASRLAHALATRRDALAAIAVFNPSACSRSDVVRTFVPDALVRLGQDVSVVDAGSGAVVPHVVERQDHPNFRARGQWLTFTARDVPPVGYARFDLVAASPAEDDAPAPDTTVMENDHYRVVVDPMSGVVAELLDKATGRSLIDADARFGFNQYIYDRYATAAGFNHLSGRLQDQNLAFLGSRSLAGYGVITGRSSTPVADQITVRLAGDGCEWVETTYTLPRDVKRLDVTNRLQKIATPEKESVYFAFPFAVADPAPLIEITGGVTSNAAPHVPGSADHFRAMRHWVALRDEGATAAWATLEAPLVEFGNIALPYLPFPKTVLRGSTGPSVIYSWALNNIWDTNFPSQQGGEMTFRYSVASGGPGDARALGQRTAASLSAPLIGLCCPSPTTGTSSDLPTRGSFCAVEPTSVELTHIAPSRHGAGLVIYLHATADEAVDARIDFGLLPVTTARRGDFLERQQQDIPLDGRVAQFTVAAGTYMTVVVELA
ncbi:MAG: glycoside hydrolase family 38 C-terminal domain-containing protein [Thermomicrobiales bacterium]